METYYWIQTFRTTSNQGRVVIPICNVTNFGRSALPDIPTWNEGSVVCA